jgi:NADH-quinone oxidoreductase subunit L
MRPGQALTRELTEADRTVVDGAVVGVATGASRIGTWMSKLQNGYVRTYAAIMMVGVVLALIAVLAWRL